ncbi:MBOAT family protein [candidate division KSB3 bacterium]|uniref:MBOAT family protein n=1 Tax=candidate division KSB3 bacterium TaxID=2044937 RepID=A0A9D5K0C6_9BACT|nr:MBOAT family protein [candidate division KSB3 bacterium]MBD3327548.1 MBOAT family protein [candidate division KSB3 bacterium]
MIFNSLFFFITLLPFLLFYFSRKRKRSTTSKLGTLGYSYFFYGMWNPAFLLLIVTSTLVDYLAARGIETAPHRKKLFLIASLITNLGLLGFFKYYNFFVDTFATVFAWVGLTWSPPLLDVLLPVGISFYTFQTLSYTIDVYRGHLPAESSLLDIAVFVAFFPQLVAGPIVRASDFLPQLAEEPDLNRREIADGIVLILFGMFLKVVVADNVAPRVNTLFGNWQGNGVFENWAAAMLFGVQIYGDFSGYSLIAIGIARVLGFSIPRNFNAPYTAAGFADFWHRWHISLSTWLRDYLYIPLGGNRKGTRRTYINLMATMLLGGLWHGASVMFVIWGGLHGIYLCLERVVRAHMSPIHISYRAVRYLLLAGGILLTYLTVSITWIPFRAVNAAQGITMMKGLFWGKFTVYDQFWLDYVVILLVFLGHCATRRYDVFALVKQHKLLRGVLVAAILLSLYYYSGSRADFIYFQF